MPLLLELLPQLLVLLDTLTSLHLYCCYNRLTNTFQTRHILPLSSRGWVLTAGKRMFEALPSISHNGKVLIEGYRKGIGFRDSGKKDESWLARRLIAFTCLLPAAASKGIFLYLELIFYPICTMMLIKYIAHEYTYRHMYPAGARSCNPAGLPFQASAQLSVCAGAGAGAGSGAKIIAYYGLMALNATIQSSNKRQTGQQATWPKTGSPPSGS